MKKVILIAFALIGFMAFADVSTELNVNVEETTLSKDLDNIKVCITPEMQQMLDEGYTLYTDGLQLNPETGELTPACPQECEYGCTCTRMMCTVTWECWICRCNECDPEQ